MRATMHQPRGEREGSGTQPPLAPNPRAAVEHIRHKRRQPICPVHFSLMLTASHANRRRRGRGAPASDGYRHRATKRNSLHRNPRIDWEEGMLAYIDAHSLKARLSQPGEIALLDVREHGEFGEGHLFF